jgi:hypothetical protein
VLGIISVASSARLKRGDQLAQVGLEHGLRRRPPAAGLRSR